MKLTTSRSHPISDRRVSLMNLTALKYAHVLIEIRWTKVREIYVRSFVHFDPTHLERPRHLNNITNTLVPHGRREAKITHIKGKSCVSSCFTQWVKYAPPYAYRGPTIPVGPHTLSPSDSLSHVGLHVVHVGSRASATCQRRATSASWGPPHI